jgi:hypothetical protein
MTSGTIHYDGRAPRNAEFRWRFAMPTKEYQHGEQVTDSECNRYMLWIDGVGAWQVCAGDTFVLGAPSQEHKSADISLLANISRRHATIRNKSDSWTLNAHHPTHVAGQDVDGIVSLTSGDEIRLAQSVRLGFRIPSALSTSAIIDFESEHRPTHSVDGVVLLSDHCLLGPRKDHHICCPNWQQTVILFYRDGQLRCRSKAHFAVNGKVVCESKQLRHGDIVAGDEFRFRIEEIQ